MDLDALALFVDVANRRSFADAARARGIDPSAVSRAIAALEARLGARLLQRTTRSMVPTEAGERLLAHLPEFLDSFGRLREEAVAARREPAGVLRVTASQAFGQVRLVPLLPEFTAAFPRIQLDLVLTDTNLDLVTERIDLAFRLGEGHRADMVGERLMATRYRVVASADHIARLGHPAHPSELGARDCLLLSLPHFRSRWLFRRGGTEETVAVKGQVMASSVIALRDAARAGLGPTLLADWLIGDDLASGRLVDLLPDYEVTATSFETALWLLYPNRDHVPNRVKAALAFFRAALRTAADERGATEGDPGRSI